MISSRTFWKLPRRAAKIWQQEGQLRKRLGNIGHLLTGNFVSSLIGLVTFALTARALGPADYGLLALTYSYARTIERLVSFQSWQPLIKYGAGLKDLEHRDDLKALLKFGLLLDVAGAILAWGVANSIALIAMSFFGWGENTVQLIFLCSTSLLFHATGMPTAVLRLAGNFRMIAYADAFVALIRLAFCALGVIMGGGLWLFALIWTASQILGSIVLLSLAYYLLRQQGLQGLLLASVRGVTKRFQGLWQFAWSTNLSLTIRSSAHEFDTLMVGALADPAAAGLYHIAKRVGRFAQQVGVHVQAVLYPDVARLWAQGQLAQFRRAVMQVEVLLAAFGLSVFLFFLIAAEPIMRWTAGPQFTGAAPLVIIQTIAVIMMLTGAALRSALLAMGRQQQTLQVVLIATGAFHITALALIPMIGAMGANIAHIVFGLCWTVGLTLAFQRGFQLDSERNVASLVSPKGQGNKSET